MSAHDVNLLLAGILVGLVIASLRGVVGAAARTLRGRDRAKGYRESMLALLELAHFRRRQSVEQPSWRASWTMTRRLARHNSLLMILVAADVIGLLVEGDDEDDDEDGGVDEVDEVRWAMIRERGEAAMQEMEQQDEAERAQVPWWRRWMR